MRILILTFYYPPDLCAGSYRARALVEALRDSLTAADGVDVISTTPNRYRSYSVEAPHREVQGNVHVVRCKVPAHRSRMLDQAVTFSAYAAKALRLSQKEQYDLVVATSSRLFTAFLGALIARWKRIPLYLDIRDIFTETIEEVAGHSAIRLVLPLLRALERFTVRTACRVNVVSEGFLEYFRSRYPEKDYSVFPNGIDDEFLVPAFDVTSHVARRRILYAGNVGDGQALHEIVPGLARALSNEVEFVIVGDGSALPKLQRALAAEPIDNVRLLAPMNRTKLIDYYRSADILFLHLGAYRSFLRVLPSKLFEYAATGKPILAGVDGFSARFIKREISNAEVFRPGDVRGAVRALARLRQEQTDRGAFVRKYRRTTIMAAMAEDVLGCIAPPRRLSGKRHIGPR